MNAETIKKIFQSPFNYPIYSREIVHSLFGCNDVLTQPELIDTSFLGDSSHYVGQMEDAEGRLLGFFYTRVAEGSDVRRKRVGLRKLIQPYLRYEVDAAIAVFDDGRHWRLSYICDHKEGTTSAKRFSYVLGDKMGQYKTPLERLNKVAAKVGHFKMEDLRDAFSVDALSKEFFDEYHRHYDRILKTTVELISKDPTLYSGLSKLFADYIKKMMGRIVFLHFLQKKGWLNGDPDFFLFFFFMQPLDRREDFLEQVLEPLFFGIFNTEPQNREKLFRDEGWDVQLLGQWKGLPYLNGGLFERDSMDTAKLKLPASLFERLFEFMASYNFTVDENDPDDADIGVDPEMLGKIFESLLEDNKAKGAFYTPKEIVRYMCKESLIAYLGTQASGLSKESGIQATGLSKETGEQASSLSKVSGVKTTSLSEESGVKSAGLSDYIRKFVEQHELPEELEPYREVLDTALRNVKICDPAIGSGAFPMGLLNELWRCREALEERATNSSQMGTQANGLSQAGSLYSKEGQSGSLNPYSRAALKREIIENNIYGVDIEKGAIDIARLRFWLSIVVDAEKPEPLPNFDYKFMQGNSLIESFDGHDLSHILDKDRGSRSIPGRSARKTGWAENQTGMEFGSDEVKQNLRNWLKMYFSLTDHKEKAYYRELINGSVKSYIVQQGIGPVAETRLNAIDPSANKDFFLWHTWFKDIFDNGGFDIVIGNPPYVSSKEIPEIDKYEYKRHYSLAKKQFDLYSLFIERGRKLAKTEGILSLIIPDSLVGRSNFKDTRQLLFSQTKTIVWVHLDKVFESADVSSLIFITINNAVGKHGFVYIKASSTEKWSLQDYSSCLVDTNNVFANPDLKVQQLSSNSSSLLQKLKKNDCFSNHFIMWRGEEIGKKSDLIQSSRDNNALPLLTGKDIHRYEVIDYYQFIAIQDVKKDTLLYGTPKILIRQLGDFINSTTDVSGCVTTQSVYNLVPKEKNKCIDYLYCFVGILNSKLFDYIYKTIAGDKQSFKRILLENIKQLPYPNITEDVISNIGKLVKQVMDILEKKETNSIHNTSFLEYEIDQQVYALYNLTPEEIAIIEQNK